MDIGFNLNKFNMCFGNHNNLCCLMYQNFFQIILLMKALGQNNILVLASVIMAGNKDHTEATLILAKCNLYQPNWLHNWA